MEPKKEQSVEEHHSRAINDFLSRYKTQDGFVAFLLAGSLAHGFAKEDSDVDIIIVATEEEYERRQRQNKLAFSFWDICKYPGGYIDCKVVSIKVLEEIAEKGSDPARYAFKDARVLYSRDTKIQDVLDRLTRYSRDKINDRQHRFACQLLAWKWYMSQAEGKKNQYLLHLATQKVTLFSCRLILNDNAELYPYHKWLLEETKRTRRKPDGFLRLIDLILDKPSFDLAQKITDCVFEFLGLIEKDIDWPNQFMSDSEMNWANHEAPIDDI